MCGYIKSRPKGDCCRLKFAFLLEPVDTINNKNRITNIRVDSLRSVTSNNSSTSSFKSAKSTNSPIQSAGTKLMTSLSSPVTPTGLLSPGSDSVFSPEPDNILRDNQNRDKLISKETTAILSSAMTSLPNGWSSMTTDDKLTSVMQSVAQIPALSTLLQSLSSKVDDFGNRLNILQEEQSTTNEKLTTLITNVATNHNKIAILTTELDKLKDEVASTVKSTEAVVDKMDLLKSRSTTSQDTSQLIIAGIPDPVVESLPSLEIATAVFKVLGVPELKSDILAIRKIDKKQEVDSNVSGRHENNVRIRPVLLSFILKMKSPQVRDHI